MKIKETQLPGLILIEPAVFGDQRGYFKESWNRRKFEEYGLELDFVQDNLSYSGRGILRGLHFQNPNPQGKLIQVLEGEVFDAVVDIRKGSPSFGQWFGVHMSAANHLQMYVPEGFAHGFLVLSESALFSYKCTDFYKPQAEYCLRWDDPDIGIEWPVSEPPTLSAKDAAGHLLRDFPEDRLPIFCKS